MRVLEILTNIVDFNPFFQELCMALKDKGVEVDCACSLSDLWGSKNKPDRSPAKMHDISFARGMNPIGHLVGAHHLNTLVSRIRPNIVHAHGSAAIFTTALGRNRHWPVTIGTFHGVDFLLMNGAKAWVLRIAESWAAEVLNEAWVINDEDYEGLSHSARNAKVLKHRSYGVGCNLERFSPRRFSSSDLHSIRTQLGLSDKHVVFTFVGRFTRHKGFDATVRAFSLLSQHHMNARLLLVGARDPIHPTGLTHSEEDALLGSPHVVDVGWQDEVERYLAIADVMVFPSHREGMPVCIMEALAMGVPVITLNTRGCREVVRNRIDGFILEDNSTSRLVDAMTTLAEDAELRSSFAEKALEGRERFNRQLFCT